MKTLLLSLALFSAPAWAQEHDHAWHSEGKHEHGSSQLSLALEGQQLLLTFDSPAGNLLGFEHAPRQAAEKARLTRTLQNLKAPEGLWQFNPEAGCRLHSAQVSSPWAQKPQHGEHADFSARYEYRCARPEALRQLQASALFKHYPGLTTLTLEFALPRQQGKARLVAKQPTAILGR